jgi:hypothetical protein
MTSTSLDGLTFAQFIATFRVNRSLYLYRSSGNAFHGLIGNALSQVEFKADNSDCRNCPIRSECRYENLYTYFIITPFDHPFVRDESLPPEMKRDKYPTPYFFIPPGGGQYTPGHHIVLNFTLIGKAIECFPFFACALKRIRSLKFGQSSGIIALDSIYDARRNRQGKNTKLYDSETGFTESPCQVLDFNEIFQRITTDPILDEGISRIKTTFVSPFQFRNRNRLGKDFSFQLLIRSILRRMTLLSVHSPFHWNVDFRYVMNKASDIEISGSSMEWIDYYYKPSNRNQKMKVGGFIGEVEFSGDLTEFLPYLTMGEYLHVGKKTSYGLGKYNIEVLN